VISLRVKQNGRILLDGIRSLAAAKYTARHAGAGAAVEAIDEHSGITWTVGVWDWTGKLPKWTQVGPKN
jgi:hypothetical protein